MTKGKLVRRMWREREREREEIKLTKAQTKVPR